MIGYYIGLMIQTKALVITIGIFIAQFRVNVFRCFFINASTDRDPYYGSDVF